MSYSTIIPKQKICKNCRLPKFIFSRGRCIDCARIEDGMRRIAESRAAITPAALDKGKKPPQKTSSSGLPAWFDMVATFIRSNPHCLNCGEYISEQYFLHASAHIIPKSIFVSVSTHPLNFLVLGAGCGCHSEYDSSIEKACKMSIWPKAVERFKIFEPLITEKHKYLELFKSKIC